MLRQAFLFSGFVFYGLTFQASAIPLKPVPPGSFFVTINSYAAGDVSYHLVVADTQSGLVVLYDRKLTLFDNSYRTKNMHTPELNPTFDRVLVRRDDEYRAFRLFSVSDRTGFTTTGKDFYLVDPTGDSIGVKQGEPYAEAMARANLELRNKPRYEEAKEFYDRYLWHFERAIDESDLEYRPDIVTFLKSHRLSLTDGTCEELLISKTRPDRESPN